MPSCIIISQAPDRDVANGELDAAGLGPENLSVPCTSNAAAALAGTGAPTHYCGHFAELVGAELDAVVNHFASPAAQARGRLMRILPSGTGVDEGLEDVGLYRILPQV